MVGIVTSRLYYHIILNITAVLRFLQLPKQVGLHNTYG